MYKNKSFIRKDSGPEGPENSGHSTTDEILFIPVTFGKRQTSHGGPAAAVSTG
jgi:hypothetical protein